ncbi:MAG: type IX secretion system protein PorQ [Bacteroidales bacterium]|jgi:hypothetical protein|nr:type IX secretion system protein PorQ [Bacteroidales bacterium]
MENEKKVLFFLVPLFFVLFPVQAQVGGTSTYGFLNLVPSPQVAALGGKVNAVPDANPALAFYNPALLDSTADNYLSMNYVNYFAGINFGYVAYSRSHRKFGNFSTGIHYINYGSFIEADMMGMITGSFNAAEYAFNFTYSRVLPWMDSVWLVGMNVKPLMSVFERYSSFGLLADIGVTYRHPEQLFTAAFVIRNMGGQLSSYSRNGREAVPFEIQLGVSQRLRHAPFRFSLVVQHLERFRLGYHRTENTSTGQTTGEDRNKKGFDLFADELMRHIILGVECTPFKGFILRGGYNYNRRQDMKISSKTGMVGFSWGMGIHISRFRIDYARSSWHLSGASNHFSVNVDLNRAKRR